MASKGPLQETTIQEISARQPKAPFQVGSLAIQLLQATNVSTY